MERNFGGKQFLIPSVQGAGQPEIDVMFFPATYGEDVVLDPPVEEMMSGFSKSGRFDSANVRERKYLSKSTIVMCNPNALIYQWMVTSVNAYWLDFFLRRDCNVLIWNYRGYGDSGQSMWSPNLTPDQQRSDAERVMQFLVNRLRVRGQIGVYGRSIGGIAASHIALKFPSLIKVFIGDRTMGDWQRLVEDRVKYSGCLVKLYKAFSCFWHIDNSLGVVKADCYKILTFDEQDDVFDSFSSLHHSVAEKLSKYDYS